MCGRYNLSAPTSQIVEAFELFEENLTITPRYNIAPTQPIPIVRRKEGGGRFLETVRWQFLPAHAGRNPPFVINARSESVSEKPFFRDAFLHDRCLFPASGFYEWKTLGKDKFPYFITRTDGQLMAFAGIRSEAIVNGEKQIGAAIITTAGNAVMKPIHDRMPVLIPEDSFSAWLDPSSPPELLASFFHPSPDDAVSARAVSRKLNNVRNESAEVLAEDSGENQREKDLFSS